MKKFCFVFFFGILLYLNSKSLFGQSSSPIIGYDKVVWGATIQTVQQNYSAIKEFSYNNSFGIRIFSEDVDIGGIKSRVFYFYQGKLYAVEVFYIKLYKEDAEILYNKIVSVYGRFNEYKDVNPYGATIMTPLTRDFIRYYNSNLTVRLKIGITYEDYERERLFRLERTDNGPLRGVPINTIIFNASYSFVSVRYSNPIVVKILDDARAKEKNDKIQL